MKAIIIEDEPLLAKNLKKQILEIDSSIEIVAVIDSVKNAITYFNQNPQPDFLLMDIQLSDGISFDIFIKTKIDCMVIFTTAYNEYAVRAFKVNSIDYLLKPISTKDLYLAIDKMKRLKQYASDDLQRQIGNVLHQLNNPPKNIFKERFTAHLGNAYTLINQDEIAVFHKDVLIYILTFDGKQYVTDYDTMDELEELLNPKFFFRANRQHIVNISAIDFYKSDSFGKLQVGLKIKSIQFLEISREKSSAFKQWLS